MYQLELYLKGEHDYALISGPTGPIVYVAIRSTAALVVVSPTISLRVLDTRLSTSMSTSYFIPSRTRG